MSFKSLLHGHLLYIMLEVSYKEVENDDYSDDDYDDDETNMVIKIPEINTPTDLDYYITTVSKFIKTEYKNKNVKTKDFTDLYKLLPKEKQHELRSYQMLNKHKNVIK